MKTIVVAVVFAACFVGVTFFIQTLIDKWKQNLK